MNTVIRLLSFFVGHTVAIPIYHPIRDSETELAGIQIFQLPLRIKLAEVFLATLWVILVTVVYGLLIERGSLASTTSMYPRLPIETNVGKILHMGWPDTSEKVLSENHLPQKVKGHNQFQTLSGSNLEVAFDSTALFRENAYRHSHKSHC
jgi:hypothetical protein